MAFFRGVGGVLGRFRQGATQFVGQRQLVQQVGFQGGQALTQLLQGTASMHYGFFKRIAV